MTTRRPCLRDARAYATPVARAGALKSGMTDSMEAGYVRLDELLAAMG